MRWLGRLLRGRASGGVVGPGIRDSIPFRLSYGEAYCPRCDRVFIGDESDPDASVAFRAHLSGPPHDQVTNRRQS